MCQRLGYACDGSDGIRGSTYKGYFLKGKKKIANFFKISSMREAGQRNFWGQCNVVSGDLQLCVPQTVHLSASVNSTV